MFAQGMFQIDQNATPDQIKRKRELLAAMMPQYGSAKYVGQGLGQLFTGIAQGRMNKSLDKAEDNQRSRISDLFSRAIGGQGGGSQAPAYSGINIAPIPADPNSPQGIANDAMVALGKAPDYAALETQYGLPSGYLARTAQIESGGNPNAQNPNSSAGGPFQFIDSTAAQYGLTDKFDPIASADAAARLAKDNAEVLRRALGREPTAAELYLAHQQGAGGAAKLLAAGDAPASGVVGRAAIDLNGGAGMTARDFANQWVDKFNGGQGGATVQPANMDVATWAEIANSPYADPGQRAYAQTMLDQITRQSDPMYQMGLEKSRLELDALRNPTPKDTRTDDMLEFEFAQQNPEFAQWLRDQKASGSNGDPASFVALKLQAQAAGLQEGSPEYQAFMLNGGKPNNGRPAGFEALHYQALAAGFEEGSPDYKEFMATRGAGLAAEARAAGTAKGEDAAQLDSMESKMAGLEEVVTKLDDLAGRATYTQAGQLLDSGMKQLGLTPRDAAVARAEYIATIDNQILPLLRDTFGAAFTQKEGETLRNTLGDPDKSPAEKQATLRAFIEQKRRDIEAAKIRTGETVSGGATHRFNPETGEIEAIQ